MKDFPFAVYLQSLLMRSLSSVLQNTGRLRDAYFETMYNYYEDPVLFCSTLAFFLDVQFCFLHRKRIASRRKRNVLTAAVVFMAVVLLFPAAGIVMNGFTYYTARYTFVLTPVFLLGMAWTLDEIRRGGRLSAPVLVISTAVLVVVCAVGYKQSVFWAYRNQAVVLLATGLLLAAVLFVFPRFAGGKREAWLLGALALLLAVNAGSEAASNFSDRVTLKRADTPADVFEEEYEEFERQAHSLNLFEAEMSVLSQPQRYYQDLYHSGVAEALDVVRSQDDSFYRVEKDYMTGSTTLAMDSLAQGYRGLSSYNSVQNAGILDFIDTCYPEVHYPDKNHLIFAEAMENNRMAAFLGVRYLLSTDADLDPEKYEKLGEFGAQILYRNRIPSSMVHFYDHAFSEDSLRKLSGPDTREDLLEGAVFLSEGEALSSTDKLPAVTDAQKDSYAVLDAPEKDSYLTGQVHAEADGYLLFMIPYEAGWHLSVDGNETGLIRGDLGFLCCRIPAGRIMAACLFLFQLHQRNRDIAEKLFPLVGELRNAAIALGGCGDGGETDTGLFPFGGIVCPVLLPDNAVEAVDSDKIELPARLADHRKPDGLFLSLAFLISSGKYRPLRITQTESRISSMYSMFTRIPFMRTRKRGS